MCNDFNEAFFTIYRGATNLGTASGGFGSVDAGENSANYGCAPASASYLDSPATTSSITYQAYFRQGGGGGSVILNSGVNSGATLGSITVLEIKG